MQRVYPQAIFGVACFCHVRCPYLPHCSWLSLYVSLRLWLRPFLSRSTVTGAACLMGVVRYGYTVLGPYFLAWVALWGAVRVSFNCDTLVRWRRPLGAVPVCLAPCTSCACVASLPGGVPLFVLCLAFYQGMVRLSATFRLGCSFLFTSYSPMSWVLAA